MHRIHIVFVDCVVIANCRIPVPELEQAVAHLCGVFNCLFLPVVSFHHCNQLAVFEVASLLKTVQKGLEGIEGSLEGIVLLLELFPGRTAEKESGILGFHLGRKQQKYSDKYA